MKARFIDFSNGVNLEDCIFMLPKLQSGLHKLDTIYSASNFKNKSDSWFYTFDQVKEMQGFYVSNKGTCTGSKYKTSKGFINRLRKELAAA